MYKKNTRGADHFWQLRCRKSARRCGAKHISSQNVQNTRGADHFWQLRCRKSARRCGAKHISKSKCTKHTILEPLLEVEMSKKCTPLWREAHFQVKMYKTPFSDHFWKLRCRKSARRCGAKHISKSKCTKHTILGPLLEVEMSKKCTPLWRKAHFEVNMLKKHQEFRPLLEVQMSLASLRFTTLHYITLHYTTLHYTTLHYTTLHYTPLHYNYTTTLHYTPIHYTTLRYLPLHFTTLHYTPLHYNYNYNYTTTLHYNTLHYAPLH